MLAAGRILARRIGGIDGKRLVVNGLRIAGAAALMGIVVWVAKLAADRLATGVGFIPELAPVALPVGLGVVTYLVACRVLGVEELAYVTQILARRNPR